MTLSELRGVKVEPEEIVNRPISVETWKKVAEHINLALNNTPQDERTLSFLPYSCSVRMQRPGVDGGWSMRTIYADERACLVPQCRATRKGLMLVFTRYEEPSVGEINLSQAGKLLKDFDATFERIVGKSPTSLVEGIIGNTWSPPSVKKTRVPDAEKELRAYVRDVIEEDSYVAF